jgi:hypothetical protein
VLDDLPGHGNYHTNMVAIGPDGWLYFSQGAMTNSGVVGLDAYDLAWLKQLPHPFDLPGFGIVLAAEVFATSDPFSPGQQAMTAAFAPFGEAGAPRVAIAAACRAPPLFCAVVPTARSCRWWRGDCVTLTALVFCPTAD